MGLFRVSVFVLVMLFLFSGCQRQEYVKIKPYDALHLGKSTNKVISKIDINDIRVDNNISKSIKDGEIVEQYSPSVDIKQWYTKAFSLEFKNNNLNIELDGDTELLIEIEKISAVYNKSINFKTNLDTEIVLKLTFKKKEVTYTKVIKTKSSSYSKPMLDGSGFDDFVTEAMYESVVNSVKIIIDVLENNKNKV